MTNPPLPNNVPRLALYRQRRVRVIGYENNRFTVLDHNDSKHIVRREDLTFIKERKK